MIIHHRINTLEQLSNLKITDAIEFDVRDFGTQLVVQHDPFLGGLDFEEFIRKTGNKRFFIVNIKSEGIEFRVLSILASYQITNFFLLDCSFPMIVKLSATGEKRLAIRFSEFEDLETVLKSKDRVQWVWTDCFSRFPLTKEAETRIHEVGLKICIVSPELQGQVEKIEEYKNYMIQNNILVDAICCKTPNSLKWNPKNGLLHFHQGFTDIINSLALITYFQSKYTQLFLLYEKKNEAILQFYCSQYSNIVLVNENEVPLWYMHQPEFQIGPNDFNLIGVHDINRQDEYHNIFSSAQKISSKFVKNFYEPYGIPYSVRTDMFEIKRNQEMEDDLYAKLIKTKPYILTHTVGFEGKLLHLDPSIESYELNNLTSYLFDAIKILEGAQEIHLIDSVWSIICFLLDYKYKLFQHVKITIYCIREYSFFFGTLPNWTIIEKNDIPSSIQVNTI